MSNTTAMVPQKPKLSNSLKDRLKRCGRYHASPEQVSKQPKLMQNNSAVSDKPLLPCSMEPCADIADKEKAPCCSLLTRTQTSVSARTTPESASVNSHKLLDEIHVDKGSLNRTPLSKKSGLCLSNVRGSKLVFDDTIDDNKHKIQTGKSSVDQIVIQKDKCDLAEKKDQCQSVTRSNLLMQLNKKEEHLRKLRLVKMYRSKNNLEELQMLIDRWRDVSQQALQDLHAAMPEPRPSLTELINHLGIDHHIVKFSVENDETFF